MGNSLDWGGCEFTKLPPRCLRASCSVIPPIPLSWRETRAGSGVICRKERLILLESGVRALPLSADHDAEVYELIQAFMRCGSKQAKAERLVSKLQFGTAV